MESLSASNVSIYSLALNGDSTTLFALAPDGVYVRDLPGVVNGGCDGAGQRTRQAGSSPCIVEATKCGDPHLIAGCRTKPTLAAVVVDPEGDAREIKGAVTLDGATAGKLKMKSVDGLPTECEPLPPGEVFTGELKLKAKGGGTLQIELMARDKAGNSSLSYALPPYDIVPNKGPTIGKVSLSKLIFQVGEKGTLWVTAELDDDCSVRRASVQFAPKNGKFRGAGSLSDNGRKGDLVAGDGIGTGRAKIKCRSAGAYALQVAVEDGHKEFAYSKKFQLTCLLRSAGVLPGGLAGVPSGDVLGTSRPLTFHWPSTLASACPRASRAPRWWLESA